MSGDSRVTRLVLEEAPPPLPPHPPREIPQDPGGDHGFDWNALANLYAQRNNPDPEWWDALGRIEIPVLVLAGGPSSYLDQAEIREMAGRIPNARLASIGAGHNIQAGEPRDFAVALGDFLASGPRTPVGYRVAASARGCHPGTRAGSCWTTTRADRIVRRESVAQAASPTRWTAVARSDAAAAIAAHARCRTTERAIKSRTLSPLAVLPGYQGRGIGSALVHEVTARAELHGEPLVVLEGDPRCYGRLGFEPGARHGIEFTLPSWVPPEAGQAIRLASYEPSIRGRVVYPTAFAVASGDLGRPPQPGASHETSGKRPKSES